MKGLATFHMYIKISGHVNDYFRQMILNLNEQVFIFRHKH